MSYIDDIVACMQGGPDYALANLPAGNATSSWAVGSTINQGIVARGEATPTWWGDTRYKSGWWRAAMPWFVIYPGVGSGGSNWRILVEDIDYYVLSRTTNQWTRVGYWAGQSFWAGYFDNGLTVDMGRAPARRAESGGAVSFKLDGTLNPIHGGGSFVDITPEDIADVRCTVRHRLVLDDPNGADDRASAKVMIQCGLDFYVYNGQAASDFTSRYVPGSGSTRFVASTSTRKATTYTPITPPGSSAGSLSVYQQANGANSIVVTEAAFRANPGPDPLGGATTGTAVRVMFTGDSIQRGSDPVSGVNEGTFVSARGYVIAGLRTAGYTVTVVGTSGDNIPTRNGLTGVDANTNAKGGATLGPDNSGNNIYTLLTRAAAEGANPDLIFLEGGTNNYGGGGNGVSAVASEYVGLVQYAQQLFPAAKVVMIGTVWAPWISTSTVQPHRTAAAALDDGTTRFWADAYGTSGLLSTDLVDGTHPTAAGAQKLASNTYLPAALRALGASGGAGGIGGTVTTNIAKIAGTSTGLKSILSGAGTTVSSATLGAAVPTGACIVVMSSTFNGGGNATAVVTDNGSPTGNTYLHDEQATDATGTNTNLRAAVDHAFVTKLPASGNPAVTVTVPAGTRLHWSAAAYTGIDSAFVGVGGVAGLRDVGHATVPWSGTVPIQTDGTAAKVGDMEVITFTAQDYNGANAARSIAITPGDWTIEAQRQDDTAEFPFLIQATRIVSVAGRQTHTITFNGTNPTGVVDLKVLAADANAATPAPTSIGIMQQPGVQVSEGATPTAISSTITGSAGSPIPANTLILGISAVFSGVGGATVTASDNASGTWGKTEIFGNYTGNTETKTGIAIHSRLVPTALTANLVATLTSGSSGSYIYGEVVAFSGIDAAAPRAAKGTNSAGGAYGSLSATTGAAIARAPRAGDLAVTGIVAEDQSGGSSAAVAFTAAGWNVRAIRSNDTAHPPRAAWAWKVLDAADIVSGTVTAGMAFVPSIGTGIIAVPVEVFCALAGTTPAPTPAPVPVPAPPPSVPAPTPVPLGVASIVTIGTSTVTVAKNAWQMVIVQALDAAGAPVAGATLSASVAAGLTLQSTTATTDTAGQAGFLFQGTATGASSLTITG